MGYLLDTRQFGQMCSAHIDVLIDTFEKHGVETYPVKISSESLVMVQECVEKVIRGVIEYFGKCERHGFRDFDECLRALLGEPTEEHGTYFPHSSKASIRD